MKKKICSFITRFGGTMAALALVVATMTANSTFILILKEIIFQDDNHCTGQQKLLDFYLTKIFL